MLKSLLEHCVDRVIVVVAERLHIDTVHSNQPGGGARDVIVRNSFPRVQELCPLSHP